MEARPVSEKRNLPEAEKRPMLTDPAEMKIIRDMYFIPALPRAHDVDPIELLERANARDRQTNNPSR